MQHIKRKTEFATALLRQGDFREVSSIVRTKVWRSEHAWGLRRDLAVPFPAPKAVIPLSVRLAGPGDLETLLDPDEPGITQAERRDRISRQHLLHSGFSSCFVAVTGDDQPCFIQWMIPAGENRILRHAFNGLFPTLAEGEMLLEGAYTPATFRGQRIMPAAMALIAEQAGERGANRVLTFVGSDNVASLKGCARAGFTPYVSRRAVHTLGFRRMEFEPLPLGDPYPFEVVAAP
jgi:RimJ/RimL family protein N-acetyltransferase